MRSRDVSRSHRVASACVRACACSCTSAFTRSSTNACVCVSVSVRLCVWVSVCVCVRACLHQSVFASVLMTWASGGVSRSFARSQGFVFVCVCMCSCVRVFMHKCLYTFEYSCVCVSLCVCVCVSVCVRVFSRVCLSFGRVVRFRAVSRSHRDLLSCTFACVSAFAGSSNADVA